MEGTLLEINIAEKRLFALQSRFSHVYNCFRDRSKIIYVTILHKNTQNIPKVFLEDIFHIWISLNKRAFCPRKRQCLSNPFMVYKSSCSTHCDTNVRLAI